MSTGYWRVAALAAGISSTLFFTGCGGGGSSNNDVAPSSLAAHSYNFSPNTGGQTAVSFTSSSTYTFQHETGAVEQGTYEAQKDGNIWSVTLLNSSGGQQVYNLNFATSTGGTFTLHRDGEADRFGPFSARDTAISAGDVTTTPASTTGSTTGTTTTAASTTTSATDTGSQPGTGTTTTTGPTDTSTGSSTGTSSSTGGATSSGSTTGTTTGTSTTGTSTTGTSTTGSTTGGSGSPSTDYTGFAPVSIAGRVMFGTRTFTSTGTSGQTHTYTFGNGTFHDSDSPEESDGTFTYSANNSSATLNLSYTAPANFSGDKHNINMTFTEKDRGTFQSIYTRGDGTEITINGTFEFQPIQ